MHVVISRHGIPPDPPDGEGCSEWYSIRRCIDFKIPHLIPEMLHKKGFHVPLQLVRIKALGLAVGSQFDSFSMPLH